MSIKMNKKIVLLALACMFLLSAAIGAQLMVAVAAIVREPGVSVGDWALYDVTFSGNGTLVYELRSMNATWVKITVQEISSTNITSEILEHYSNGTEETSVNLVNVDTGQGNGTGIFIAANLNASNLIYTSSSVGLGINFTGATINETISRTYSIGTLEVNHLNITTTSTSPGVMNQTLSTNYYWRKTTGMLTELSLYAQVGNMTYMTWVDFDAVIAGVIPEFPPALILPLFMIATIAAVWLGKAIWSTKKLTRKTSTYA
jgi:hypothetical protein